jgi:spore coat protein U-like protein
MFNYFKNEKMKNLLLVSILMFAFAAATFAQSSASSAATATIVSPISISNVRALEFGNIAAATAPGTVTLTPVAVTVRSATVVTLPAVTGTVSSAQFDVTGTPAYTYSIAIAPASVNITNGGGITMSVGTFTSTPTVAAGGTLDGTGAQTIYVGGTLSVGANQAPGTYSNATAFTVTVNYN